MNARKILCLMTAMLMLSGCSKGVDGSQASSKAAESSGKADSSVSDYDNTTTEPETDKPEFDLNDSVIGFSQESGFYDSGFSLELTANEGGKIYYTTDGTDPRTSATREEYTAPIEIKDRSNDPNVVSAVPTEMISGNFNEFSFGEGDFWCNKKAPSDNAVDKCTVIRASSEKSDGSVSKSFSGSFYIGSAEEHIKGLKESCEAAGHDLAVMNITMDYGDLFDSKIGIYVKGDIFNKALEDYKASGESIENETARQLDANYKQRGKEWERDCHIELNEISAEGNVTNALSQDCGIRIQGAWSRADYQKSFRLYARNDYGKSSFDTVFWDSFTDVNGEAITSCKTFVLRNGGNDANYSKFKDMMIQNMVSGRGVETQQGTACVLFIDGEYWGLYTLQSDYGDRYFADRYNVAKSNVVMYKNDKLSEGEAEDEKLFNDMYKFITENDMSIEENYRKACAMIDMDNLVEYAATEMYIFNDDWPQNNYACWRTRTIEQGNSYADGRWRFVLFDTESSCSHYNEKNLETNMFSYLRSQSYTTFGGILCSLIDNEEFDLKLTSAMCQLGSVNFTAERFGEYLEYYKNIYYGELDNYFDRFPTWANLAKATDPMIIRWQNFIEGRYDKVLGYLEREFDYYERRTVKISADNEQGNVLIGGVEIESDYSGTYFDGCEIKLNAQAKSGWHFDHWEGVNGDNTQSEIKAKVNGDMNIKAVFEKDIV